MNIGSSFLPPETLSLVAGYLNPPNVMNVRLVCKALNAAAFPFLIQEVWISTDPRDRERLNTISTHEIFHQSVRTIKYDATVLEYEWTDAQAYVDALGGKVAVHEPGYRNHYHRMRYANHAVLRGYQQYQKDYRNQEDAHAYNENISHIA